MAVVGNSRSRTPAAEDLLARWRHLFRTADYAGLTDLYHHQAFLLGGTAAPSVGRDKIRAYFESLASPSGADVEFSQVSSRFVRSDVVVVLALAEFTATVISLPMWLTQIWIDDWAGWVIASHHASPVGKLRGSRTT